VRSGADFKDSCRFWMEVEGVDMMLNGHPWMNLYVSGQLEAAHTYLRKLPNSKLVTTISS
jgi:hypothetical protein